MKNEKELLIEEWITTGNKKLIKKILKYCSAKEFYKKCKEMYKITNDKFYIKSMQKINFIYYLKSHILMKRHKKDMQKKDEINKLKTIQLDKMLNSICLPKNAVYIMQCSFFDKKGENYFSGGGERYACDLANLIKQIGYTPILLQQGDENMKEPWVQNFQDLTVIGINATWNDYIRIIGEITSPALTIYSGCVNWTNGKKGHTPSIMISHGITWDCPVLDANINSLKSILNTADTFVSVDTNTISWFRSTFAKTIKEREIQFEYIPNYVDLEKYYPSMNKEPNKPIKILFPRRCSDERGFWLLADIIPMLCHNYSNIQIDLVGFPHSPEIKNTIKTLEDSFPEKVKHYVCNAEEMNEVYRNADITLIPTLYSEGTSLSCIEAMASGNAVISTNIGGLTNLIINGYNGLLINPDKTSLLEAINKLLSNNSLRQQLQNNAILVSKEFSKQNWICAWEKILFEYLKSDNNIVILTRNAIHGGVESIVKQESDYLNANVIVCGGIEKKSTTPFSYTRADDEATLYNKLKRYDTIIYHWIPDYALSVLKQLGKKSIEFVHRTDCNCLHHFTADAYITHSKFLSEYVKNKTGKNCEIIPHPINTELFKNDSTPKKYIGGLTSYYKTKGIDLFIKAWAKIKDEFPEIKARFYGEGDDLESLKQLSKDLNADVDFLPPTTEPYKVLKEFQCIVSPSRIEGMPVAILEALSMNIPVIASDLDGMIEFSNKAKRLGYPEIMHIVPAENIDNLALAIKNILSKKHLLNTRKYIENYFSIEEHCKVLEKVIQNLK